jgi:hypothetical protein
VAGALASRKNFSSGLTICVCRAAGGLALINIGLICRLQTLPPFIFRTNLTSTARLYS